MDATSFEAVQNGFMSGEGPANTDTLSDAIALGSILLKGRLLWVSATLGFVILGMLLMSCKHLSSPSQAADGTVESQ